LRADPRDRAGLYVAPRNRCDPRTFRLRRRLRRDRQQFAADQRGETNHLSTVLLRTYSPALLEGRPVAEHYLAVRALAFPIHLSTLAPGIRSSSAAFAEDVVSVVTLEAKWA